MAATKEPQNTNGKELKAIADKFAAVKGDREAITKLHDATCKAHAARSANDDAVRGLCEQYYNAVDETAYAAVAGKIKAKSDTPPAPTPAKK